ncbi:MAG: phospho-sugar mutase [Bacilli bacterium]|nr:phospho-sugar mutase [Bacilli bacterium]
MNPNKLFKKWINHPGMDETLLNELNDMSDDQIKDSFYRDLEFGTAGLRGVIGAGTNRMNIYTVAKASLGLAKHILLTVPEERRSVAISRDSRINSDLFAKVAAEVFASNGIKVHFYKDINPVPALSFATRELHCSYGVMITASHNPSKYNGYKVYGADGCQITDEAANAILTKINAINPLKLPERATFEEYMAQGLIEYISDEVIDRFIENVKAQSLIGDAEVNKDVSIVYSPLNGAGLVPVLRVLRESGYTNITVVKEQEQPDGNFPTCPYPNPEIRATLELGLSYCKEHDADLMLATDPDCDRVGIAVKNAEGEHVLMTGNQVGVLLLNYICERRTAMNKMPEHPVMVKSLVSMNVADKIAAHYGVETKNVLTGFKYIGEQIGNLEREGKEDSYIFGFEESYGYLSGTYVRDKDGVNGASLIAEMFAYYKTQGISLLDKLEEIWKEYGYTLNTLHSYEFEGPKGMDTMNSIVNSFRHLKDRFCNLPIIEKTDYLEGVNGLPKSNVLKIALAGDYSLIIRPSGTEPKLKVYISIKSDSKERATTIESRLENLIKSYFAQGV